MNRNTCTFRCKPTLATDTSWGSEEVMQGRSQKFVWGYKSFWGYKTVE